MVKVLLEEWARIQKISLRTAQTWAQKDRIEAVRVKKMIAVKKKRPMMVYVIDRNAPRPQKLRGKDQPQKKGR